MAQDEEPALLPDDVLLKLEMRRLLLLMRVWNRRGATSPAAVRVRTRVVLVIAASEVMDGGVLRG